MHEIPAIEKMSNPARFEAISDNPAAREVVKNRHQRATAICKYLNQPCRTNLGAFYESATSLLGEPENQRLALYLPLEELYDAPDYFRASYLAAWRKCLKQEDVRENFNLGDSLEVDARDENFPYVVKAAHLIPWLLRSGYLREPYILELLKQGSDCLVRSICDCEKLFYNVRYMASPELQLQISKRARALPKKESKPLYDSPERQKWRKEFEQEKWGDSTPRNLAGPFSANFHGWEAPKLQPAEIALIGGSYLKGYSSAVSDLDFYLYDPAEKSVCNYCDELKEHCAVPDQNIAHICLDTVWFSYRSDLSELQHDCVRRYLALKPDSIERRQSLERLEQDLLQYRLMHKGIKRIYDKVSENTVQFPGIDGASAFYDRRYRGIASQLFAKYVFLPQI